MGTLCADVCRCRQHWVLPARATRALLGTRAAHVLPALARTAQDVGLAVRTAPGLLDVADHRGGRDLERFLRRLAGETTAAESDAVRIVTDPPGGDALTGPLLAAPTLAVELARRGITAEIGLLADAELWSAYQPVVSLEDRSVVAHQALLRGVVDGREVGGGTLFFVAEAAGWLHRLDRIARESAVVGAGPWLGDADLFVMSDPRSVRRPQVCLAGTERAVHDSGLSPRQMVVEVVGSQLAADRGHLLAVLEHYRSLGWRVALDDAGAVWSSPSLLAAVRPDVVKLDKGLVQALPDAGARAVAAAVVDRAHTCGAVVVAEGVETECHADEVAALGADLAQGWLFGRPVLPRPPVVESGRGWQPVAAGR